MSKPFSYAFFGTATFAVSFLEALKAAHAPLPSLIITNPDRPKGRGLELAEPPVKSWAKSENIEFLQPEKLDAPFIEMMKERGFDLFAVVAYGSLMPKALFELPRFKTVNVHPSLLPLHRGASPIESQILADDMHVGVTLIEIDEKMDHGPILAQESLALAEWPTEKKSLATTFAALGAKLFVEVIEKMQKGSLAPVPQNEAGATYTKKIRKEDGLISLDGDPRKNYLKYLAFQEWPRLHFLSVKNGVTTRIVITEASFKDGTFTIKKVIPEGKKEISYEEYLRANGSN